MFKKIKQLLNKTTQTKQNMNMVSIILTKDKDPYIHISIEDTQSESAIKLAKMLYDLNGGNYADGIIKILMSIGEEDQISKVFVAETIMHWSQNIKKINEPEPLIKPTDFFKKA